VCYCTRVPFPLLAHQAPILPLKRWRPDWFSGTALVMGSIAPDLEYLTSTRPRAAGFCHSLEGQFLFCLPVSLAVIVYFHRMRLGEALASRLGWPLLAKAASDAVGLDGLFKVIVSTLCGSFSHLALDAFTHRWVPKHLGFLGYWRRGSFLMSAQGAAQLLLTAVGAVITVWLVRKMIKEAEPAPPVRSDGRRLLMASALVGAVLGGWRARPAFRDPGMYFEAAHIYVWGYALFHVACGVAAAWLVVGGFLAWKDARVQPAQPETPP